MRTIWIMGLALGLAACAQQTPRGAGTAIAVQRSDVALPPARGETRMTVRAFEASGGEWREISGATCELTSAYFTATVQSPGDVALPDLGSQAPAIEVACSDGVRTGTQEVLPQLRSGNGLAGWPAVGISVGTGDRVGVSFGGFWGGGWGTGPGTRRAVYPGARVILE